jgi:hypothetical protein
MKFVAVIAFVVGMFTLPAAHSQDTDSVGQAKVAATQWIALADAGDYAASWDQAASAFRVVIAKPNWSSAMLSVRSPLGTVKSRKLKSAEFTKSLPGAPDGEYVVIQFETTFENKVGAVETVTPMKDKDGTWRISGYFIK